MKLKSGLLIVYILSLSVVSAQTINFRNISLEEAIIASAQENKPVLFMAYQSTCHHCEKMLTEVFTDTALGSFFTKNYITIKQDLIGEAAKTYKKQFSITSFPTFAILNEKSETLYQFVGFYTASEFINQGKLALDIKNQLPFTKANFEKNTRDSTACYNYLLVLSRGRLATQPVANTYFNAHNKNPEISEMNWKIFSMSVNDMNSEVFNYMIKNRDAYAALVTQKKVDRKIYLTAAFNLQSSVNLDDTIVYYKNRKVAQQLNLHTVDSIIFLNDLNLYEKNKLWDNFMFVALKGTERFVWNDANQLRRICDVFIKYSNDPTALLIATKFAVRCAALSPEYYNYLAAANLYFKNGDKTNAKTFATKAKEIGIQKNMNVSEADLIITKSEE